MPFEWRVDLIQKFLRESERRVGKLRDHLEKAKAERKTKNRAKNLPKQNSN
jgi:hypothetical protein